MALASYGVSESVVFRAADIAPRSSQGGLSLAEVVSRVSDGVSVTPGIATQVRIGHFVEAQILEALEIDYIDESEVPRTGRGERGRERLSRVAQGFGSSVWGSCEAFSGPD